MKQAGSIDMIALFVWVAALGTIPMFAVSFIVEGTNADLERPCQSFVQGGRLHCLHVLWGNDIRLWHVGHFAKPVPGVACGGILAAGAGVWHGSGGLAAWRAVYT